MVLKASVSASCVSKLLDAAPAAAPLLWGAPHSLKSRHQAGVVVVVESLWPSIAQRLATSTLSTQIKTCLSCWKISDFTHSICFLTSVWTLFFNNKANRSNGKFSPWQFQFFEATPVWQDFTALVACLFELAFMSSLVFCYSCFSPGAKERNVAPQLTDFEIPTSFWYELKSLTDTLMDNVNCESALIQTKCM